MALVSLAVGEIVAEKAIPNGKDSWGWDRFRYEAQLNTTNINKLNANDTYMIVFGPHQNDFLKVFKEQFDCNILYEAPKSCNSNYSGDGPRNTLFIFEMKDKENDQKAST